MNTEPRFREAVEGLWSHTVAVPEEGLAVLLDTDRRRRKQGRLTLAAAAAAVVVAGWWGVTSYGRDHAARPAPSQQPPATSTSAWPCQALYVTCLGSRTYRFDLSRPVTWTIPLGFGVDSGAGADNGMVQSYGQGRRNVSGVAVLENVGTAAPSSQKAPGAPIAAPDLVTWLTSRPFLDATPPHRTTLDGFSAWQVRVTLSPGASPPHRTCTIPPPAVRACYPLTVQWPAPLAGSAYDKPIISGVSPDMTADYTVVDLGDNTATVVLSWAPRGDTAALEHDRALIQGIHWPITP